MANYGTVGRLFAMALATAALLAMQGCLATKVVTVPVKIVYVTGKLAAKGTAAAVRAVVADDDEEEESPPPPDAQPPSSPAR